MRGRHGNPMYVDCLQCGKSLRTYPSRHKSGKDKFCSRSCAHKYRTKPVKCLACGLEWDHPKSQRGDKYCSMKCRVVATTKMIICRVCGKQFRTWISRKKSNRGKYCSSACYWKSLGIDPKLLAEHKRDSCKRYRKAHPDWCAEVKHRRRARESNGHFTAAQWKDIKRSQNHTCLLCGKSEPEIKLTVDHIIPLSKNGSNDVGNIQGLCGSCNSRKSFN